MAKNHIVTNVEVLSLMMGAQICKTLGIDWEEEKRMLASTISESLDLAAGSEDQTGLALIEAGMGC